MEIKLEEKCMTLEEELPSDLQLSGVWVRNRGNPYLENLEDHTKYRIPLEGGGLLDDILISPDSKLLAYLDRYVGPDGRGTDKWVFRIVKPNGYLMVLQNWIFDVREILGWASNSEIVLKVYSDGIKYIVYNPFTGEWQEIVIDTNIVYNPYEEEIISTFGSGDYFNPNMIFFQTLDGNKLYDVRTWKKLLDIDLGYAANCSWSPDLASIIIIPYIDGNQENLYVIRNDEVFLKLNVISTGLNTESNEWISGQTWSPNSQKFIVNSWNKLAIMNLETFELRRICINYDPEFEISYPYSFIWSPDSRFLILHYDKYNPQGIWEYFDILVDTQNMRAFRLSTDDRYEFRMGWLASP